MKMRLTLEPHGIFYQISLTKFPQAFIFIDPKTLAYVV